MKLSKFILIIAITLSCVLLYFGLINRSTVTTTNNMPSLLTDPFLQLPKTNSVNVVWFTEFPGDNNWVLYGSQLENKVTTTTTKLTRVREDSDSNLEPGYQQLTNRDIWRHEATITGLNPEQRIPYQVVSLHNGETVSSKTFTLTSKPKPNTPLKILLTSDHQLMPMTAANLQKVVETIERVDGVFVAGDLVNYPDRGSEWFDDNKGGAFFPGLQGKANYKLEKNGAITTYKGGEIIQYAPLFTALGNHEVMGRHSTEKSIRRQFYDAVPRDRSQVTDTADITTIKNNSFNTDTYEEIFSLPKSKSGGEKYYAVTFGDIRLVVLYVTNIWRFPQSDRELPARYQESPTDYNSPENWGYGQHIFESIEQGSPQYQWLESELQSEEFQQAKYRMVMFHHPPHTLGGNIVPPYTNPQQTIQRDNSNNIQAVTYEYPKENDYIIRDLIPLLENAGVQFVYYGHSHLWNRFQSDSGMHFLESSNVGNSYGAHTIDNPRPVPNPNNPNYIAVGNPNGLEPIMPNIDPVKDETGQPLPYIASNDITVFSILDTEQGTVSSYRFDTRQPDSQVVKFDEFKLGR